MEEVQGFFISLKGSVQHTGPTWTIPFVWQANKEQEHITLALPTQHCMITCPEKRNQLLIVQISYYFDVVFRLWSGSWFSYSGLTESCRLAQELKGIRTVCLHLCDWLLLKQYNLKLVLFSDKSHQKHNRVCILYIITGLKKQFYE